MTFDRGFGLDCPDCACLYSRVVETRGDVLDPRQLRRIRVLECKRCRALYESVEIRRPVSGRARIPDPRRRLEAIRSERYRMTGS